MHLPRVNRHIARTGWLLLALLGLVLALAGARVPVAEDGAGEVLAWVNERPVSRPELDRAARRLAAADSADLVAEQRGALIQFLVDEELLLQRAESLGVLQADPGVRKAIVRASINEVVAEFLATPPKQRQLEQFYQQHRAVFERPARLAVAAVSFDNAALARQALADAGDDWDKLIADSEGRPVPHLPDSPLPAHMLRRYLGPGPASAVQSLAPGQISEPVPGAAGVYLLTMTAKAPATVAEFEQIEPLVRQEYLSRGRELALTGKLAELWHSADIQINPSVDAGRPGQYVEQVVR